jgi:gluconate kinase
MTSPPRPLVVVLLRAAGSGVTVVGQALAEHWGWPYHDGNAFDPLDALHWKAEDVLAAGDGAVIGCAALDQASRDLVRGYLTRLVFVQLDDGSADYQSAEDVVHVNSDAQVDEVVRRIAQAVTAWQANDTPPPPV